MLSVHSHDHYMKLALQQAQIAYEQGEIPVGSVIVCQNKVIAKAYNQVELLNDVTAHAEMLAITAAQNHLRSKYLEDCQLYVTLEPCTMCSGALFWSQIGSLIIGASDDKRGYSRLQPDVLHPKTIVKRGVMKAAASELISDFFAQMREKQKRKQ